MEKATLATRSSSAFNAANPVAALSALPADEGDEYRITAELSRGAITTLHRGYRTRDLLPVILKTLNPGHYGAYHLERLRSEYRIATRLKGVRPIVRAHGFAVVDGVPGIVLEDFGGVALDRLLHDETGAIDANGRSVTQASGRPLSTGRFLDLAVRIAEAVAELHAHDVVHRDLKPQNLIVRADTGEIRITDFGISIVLNPGATLSTAGGVIEGTLAYLAPEQTGKMNRPIDLRTDLYSLGVTLYRMATGALPFDADDTIEWIHCHIAREPAPPNEVNPALPKVVSDLILKLLAKPAEERYQSADGLRRDLERCRDEWRDSGGVAAFPLATVDGSGRFQLSHRLYGREREVRTLESTIARIVERRSSEILFVAGEPGIGKSSLVHELYRPVIESRGMLISGKFDQYRRHVPYATTIEAVRELVQQVLAEPDERLAEWKRALVESLGLNAGVLLEVVPELEWIVGPQPAPAVLGAAESQNRFQLVFQSFLRVFARPGRPLVVFLDDMQWADSATLSLVRTTLASNAVPNLLFLLAYRDTEVGPGHPFGELRDALRKSGAPLEELRLEPLDRVSLGRLVADSLDRPRADGERLAEIVIEKTRGNPFFSTEFLKALHRGGLLRFGAASRAWEWDEAGIRRQGYSDNVISLLVERLKRLPAETLRALTLAACFGNTFPTDLLALVTETPVPELEAILRSACEDGLLLPTRGGYRFQHDRIQQACYQLIEEGARSRTHLAIGRHLKRALDSTDARSPIFDVVNHLNHGVDLITDATERSDLADLNFTAGARAKRSNAYADAERAFARGLTLLDGDAWVVDYPRRFEATVELAECAYLTGRLEESTRLFAEVLERAETDLDRARVYSLQIQLFQVAGEYEAAYRTSVASFELLGLPVPADDVAAGAETTADIARARERMSGREPADLLELPRMTDPRLRRLMSLLEASGPPVYMVRPALFSWVALKLLLFSLEYGNCEASCYGYGIYGIIAAGALGDVETGYRFSRLAIDLNERLDDPRLKGCMLHLLGDHVNFWKHPIATDLPILERGFRACLDGGDLIYSNYIAFQSIWHLWEKGDPLERVLEYSIPYAEFALQSKHRANFQTIRTERQFMRALAGATPSPASLNEPGYDEDEAFAEIEAADFGCGIVYFHLMKTILAYFAGDDDAALAASERARPVLGAAFSMPIETSFYLFRALALARSMERATVTNGANATEAPDLTELREIEARFLAWEKNCAANFECRRLLVTAEIRALEGDRFASLRALDRATTAAREQGFTQYEAIAREITERVYLREGLIEAAHSSARAAASRYAVWGARPKCAQIERRVPALRTGDPGPEDAGTGATAWNTSTGSAFTQELDLLSVVKASQSISSEMESGRLLSKLIDVVTEYAGATRGLFVRYDGAGGLYVTSESSAAGGGRALDPEIPLAEAADIAPLSVIQYVHRTREKFFVEEVAKQSRFAGDAYVAARKPKSILCFPILRLEKPIGVLYLENDRSTGAFGIDRLEALDILSSQVAISVENARLFDTSQRAVRTRDEFLSIASHELKTPLTALKLQMQISRRKFGKERDVPVPAENVRDLMDRADRGIERLCVLVDDMLDISKLSTSGFRIARARIELGTIVDEALALLQPLLHKAGCEVRVVAAQEVFGNWDRHRLLQVVSNLVTNAAKYGAGAPIEISIREVEGTAGVNGSTGVRAELRVCDSGPGIARADQERIFRRFERAISANEVSGLGLGLAIASEIVALHEGTLRVESELGKGATFIVSLSV